MDLAELVNNAEQILNMHRNALLLDPFIKITLEFTSGDYISECVKGSSALSWKIKLNPQKHLDIIDVQYSIVDSLLIILFDELVLADNDVNLRAEHRKRLIARLSTSVCQMMSIENEDFNEG